jgi:hypothetical protein
LQIYSAQALREIVDTLPKNARFAGDAGQSGGLGAVASGDTLTSNALRNQPVIEGWDIEQWRTWGRKKSALASNICQANGELKARIIELESRPSGSSSFKVKDGLNEKVGPCLAKGASLSAVSKFSLQDPFRHSDPWSNKTVLKHDYKLVQTMGCVNALDSWRTQRKRPHKGLKLQQISHRQCAHGDLSDEADDTSLVVDLEKSKYAQENASKRIVKDDRRALPVDAFQFLYDSFPRGPCRYSPDEYVQQRWPAHQVLLKAARHWKEYGPCATLPADMYQLEDSEGSLPELETLREVFRDAHVLSVLPPFTGRYD